MSNPAESDKFTATVRHDKGKYTQKPFVLEVSVSGISEPKVVLKCRFRDKGEAEVFANAVNEHGYVVFEHVDFPSQPIGHLSLELREGQVGMHSGFGYKLFASYDEARANFDEFLESMQGPGAV